MLKYSFLLIATIFLCACDNNKARPATKESAVAVMPPTRVEPTALTAQINRSPMFETSEGWSAGYAKAVGHGLGVVVGPGGGNPNVFAQQFLATPGEYFKLVARATSVNKSSATGRFQINWVDSQGQFISASIQTFKVTPEEKKFEHVVSAPSRTATGTLYVVADGSDSMVRYTEMRLLGEIHRAPELAGRTSTMAEPQVFAVKPLSETQSQPLEGASPVGPTLVVSPNPFPRPPNLTPLDGSGKELTPLESQYYFYHAAKTMQRKASERGMDFIMYVMPDYNIARLMPAITQLRAEGIKVLAYEPKGDWTSGVDTDWYWQKADSHWSEAAARLTADEILRMWKTHRTENRPFSQVLMQDYAKGLPAEVR
ncbi:MAG: hypothetical protein JWN23_430 [Rhodocyclales bacterium]|nr:hypothetical protein [Rhodocyclales bacterium]